MPKNDKVISASGFTLVEVLATLLIFSIVSVLLFSGMTQVEKNKEINEEKAKKLESLQEAFSLLQFDMMQVVKDTELDVKKNPQGTFFTDKNNLHFNRLGFVNPENENHRSTIEKVIYYLDGNKLIRRSSAKSNQQQINEFIIFDNVKSVRWHFIGNNGDEHDIWPPVQSLEFEVPFLIRIDIELDKIGSIEKLFELPGASYAAKIANKQ